MMGDILNSHTDGFTGNFSKHLQSSFNMQVRWLQRKLLNTWKREIITFATIESVFEWSAFAFSEPWKHMKCNTIHRYRGNFCSLSEMNVWETCVIWRLLIKICTNYLNYQLDESDVQHFCTLVTSYYNVPLLSACWTI